MMVWALDLEMKMKMGRWLGQNPARMVLGGLTNFKGYIYLVRLRLMD